MDVKELINIKFDRIESQKSVLFAISFVDRISPIIDEFSTDETKRKYKEIAQKIKEFCVNQNVDITRLMDDFDEIPESHEDDSHKISYYSMISLGNLYYAIKIAQENEIADINNICIHMRNLCRELDVITIKYCDGKSESIEEIEVETQKEIINSITSLNIEDLIILINKENERFRVLLEKVIPNIYKCSKY